MSRGTPAGRRLCTLLRLGNRQARARVRRELLTHLSVEMAARSLGISGPSLRIIVPELVEEMQARRDGK